MEHEDQINQAIAPKYECLLFGKFLIFLLMNIHQILCLTYKKCKLFKAKPFYAFGLIHYIYTHRCR